MVSYLKRNWVKYLPPVALVVFLSTTDPNNLDLVLFLLPVLLLLLTVYLFVGWVLSKVRVNKASLTNKTIAALISFIASIVVVMQLMSQLTSGDAILFLLIASVMAVYLYKSGS